MARRLAVISDTPSLAIAVLLGSVRRDRMGIRAAKLVIRRCKRAATRRTGRPTGAAAAAA